VVARTGVDGKTVTVRTFSGLIACDTTRRGRNESGPWCGSSFGRLYDGRLRDPRLDIGPCTTRDGTPVAFAWIEPDPRVRYLAVADSGYVEVYEVAAGLPTRISTRNVRADAAGASFEVTEHDARGALLRRLELDAVPAG
jgi:hypothetical protein